LKYIFHFCVKFIRPITSAFFYNLFKHTFSKNDSWNRFKQLPLEQFADVINAYPYKSDPLWGALDYTIEDPRHYFCLSNHTNPLFGADCDDTAETWLLWAKENNISGFKLYICDGWRIWNSHVTCVLEMEGRYLLCDYGFTKVFNSIEDIVRFLKHEYNYHDNILNVIGENNGK